MVFHLTKSYRCSNIILQASANVIDEKNSLSGLKKGVKILIHQSETDKSEAEFIARKIENISGGMRFFSWTAMSLMGMMKIKMPDLMILWFW